jgi:hypothetical protein
MTGKWKGNPYNGTGGPTEEELTMVSEVISENLDL